MQEFVLMVKTVFTIAGLGYLSIEDVRRKEITIFPVLMIGLVGGILSAAGGEWQNWKILYRYLPGVVCLIIGRLSSEAIGYGDGLVILSMGSCLTLVQLLNMCLIAVTLAGVTALFLLLVQHRGKTETMPLIPFLLLGYGAILIL